ncbi:MAG: site-2 protease family protein [bacterium]
MELYDVNRIDAILKYEFGDMFFPMLRGIRGEEAIYQGRLKPGSGLSLEYLITRFHELGYNVRVLSYEPRVTLIFTHRDQQQAERPSRRPQKYGLHLVLFLLTIVSTLWAGAMQYNVDIIKEPLKIWMGLPFSIPLLMILTAHEMGHYIVSLKHKILSTLPYFIPFPNIIGTMGAIIKMKSAIPDRKALMDVGMAGPLAGAVLAIPTIIVGLKLSTISMNAASEAAGGIILGESLLFKLLTWLVHGSLPSSAQIIIHPIAFAGWVGLLVTFMNLFPASQLDGGHISYALFGPMHKTIGRITCLVFAVMGIFYWPWFIWMLFVFFIGLGHPAPINDRELVDGKRRILGMVCLGLFVLTCTPRPFYGEQLPTSLISLIRAFMG